MKNAEYWADRFTALDDLTFKKSEKYARNLQKQFDAASKKLSKDTAYWYGKLALNNEISYSAAKKLLKADELSEFHWTVNEYIKYGKQAGLDPEWIKQLENASAKVHISRLEQMQTDMRQTVESLYKEYETGAGNYLEGVTTTSYYHTAYEVAKGTGIGVNLHRLDKDTVSDFLTRPWCQDGQVFSDRIWQRKDDLIETLNTALAQNLITGADPQKTIDMIAERFGVEKRAAGRLVMTETAAITSEARRKCMKDLDVEEYEVVATLDSRTSAICRQMDGKHFKMSEFKCGLNAPPFHCNCRSTTVPYFNDEFTKNETRAAREVGDTGYQRSTSKTYKEWAKKVQKEYGDLYKVSEDWEYKDWYDAVVEGQCKGLMKMDLQFFAEQPSFVFGCSDTTKDWIRSATPNSHPVIDAKRVTLNEIEYSVDGDNVYIDYEPGEKHIAEVIESKLGGEIQMNPKFRRKYEGIQCGDYTFRGELWDLKTLETKPGKDLMFNAIHKKKKQALNFIVDISNNPITTDEAIIEAERLFKRRGTYFVKNVMLIKNDEIVKILTRK